jgi:hypothetical protein
MASKLTNEPVASAPRSVGSPQPKTLSPAGKPRSLVGGVLSWLRGDRHMVGAYPPPPTADAVSPETER